MFHLLVALLFSIFFKCWTDVTFHKEVVGPVIQLEQLGLEVMQQKVLETRTRSLHNDEG